MNLVEFIEKNWSTISENPLFFVTNAFLFSTIGFLIGKLFYGTVTSIVKERLEAARDDAARLERAKRDESDTVTKLQAELDSLKSERNNNKQRPVERQDTIAKTLRPIIQSNQNKGNSEFAANTESYFLSIPHRNLSDALNEAQKNDKLVFAVIYDETHPRQSKLTHSLGYFMEYHTTKKLVDEYFVPAVVKVSNKQAAALVPKDDPLENCLWVVMKASGEVLRREGVYANPDEGLKRVRAVIADAKMA
ncbi:hypothetical protein [Pseudomonas bubulae]|uniref:hypothetical protein n=1 Tax=Pseudomonas bubulae TaxID=2316085 RepID=UPI002B1DCEAF|nr:hypothetical protein [Pseudomonas bubulae]